MGQRGGFALLAEHVFKCNRAVVGILLIVLHKFGRVCTSLQYMQGSGPGKAVMAFNGY